MTHWACAVIVPLGDLLTGMCDIPPRPGAQSCESRAFVGRVRVACARLVLTSAADGLRADSLAPVLQRFALQR
jgi:hypothetical protein